MEKWPAMCPLPVRSSLPGGGSPRPPPTQALGTTRSASKAASYRLDDLGGLAVDEETIEIKLIPDMFKLIKLGRVSVNIDADGCQPWIAERIVEPERDDIPTVSGDQGTMCGDQQALPGAHGESRPGRSDSPREDRAGRSRRWHPSSARLGRSIGAIALPARRIASGLAKHLGEDE